MLRRFIRRLTGGAWSVELQAHQRALVDVTHESLGWKRQALIRESQLAFLEELFREKQDKITRLQRCYIEQTKPDREDMRQENPVSTAQSLMATQAAFHERAQERVERTGQPPQYSDGTVLGTPGQDDYGIRGE